MTTPRLTVHTGCALRALMCFVVGAFFLGCNAGAGSGLLNTGDTSSTNDDGANSGSSAQGSANNSGASDGSATGGPTAGKPMPLDSIIQARVRNESSSRVDMTMRFLHDGSAVNESFVRVPPKTVTTVSSPEMADEVELSGLDESGRTLESEMFVFGVDFDSGTPAEYVVRDPDAEVSGEAVTAAAPSLTLLEPSAMVTRAVGSMLSVSWSDLGGGPAGLVRLYLRPVGNNTPSLWTPIGPAFSAQYDGINDSLSTAVPSVKNGLYEVVGRLQAGGQLVTAVAPGAVKVVSNPRNAAPTLTILSPTVQKTLTRDEEAKVQWKAVDPRQTGIIRFSLERSDGTGTAIGRFVVGAPIPATAHNGSSDSAALPMAGVLPGLYDLVGTIDDGRFTGTARVERVIRVLPPLLNDSPQLQLSRPATDVQIEAGGAFAAAWKDSDNNDDARISFYLDPDSTAVVLDGNEQLLQTGVREDPDGAGDKLELRTPADLAVGTYRVVGVITDGVTQVVTRAPGYVKIRAALPLEPPPTDTKPVTSGGAPGSSAPPPVGGGSDEKPGEGKDETPPAGGGTTDPDKSGDDKSDDGKSDDSGDDKPGGGGTGSDAGGDKSADDDGATGSPEVVVVIPDTDLPSDRVDPPGDVPGDDAETRPQDDGNNGTDDTPAGGVVVVIPNANLPSDRVDSPIEVPSETGTPRPQDGGTDDPRSRDVVVLIPNADLPANRVGTPTEVPGDEGSTRPRDNGGIGLFASNVRFGGETTVDITPAGWTGRDADANAAVPVSMDAIPNDAWPRTFDVLLTNGTRVQMVSSKPVVVPQAVEILEVAVGGLSCGDGADGATAAVPTVQITWFGGGTVDSVAPATVEFWVSADSRVPSDGLDNSTHRLMAIAPGSPNYVRNTQVDWWTSLAQGAGKDLLTPDDAPALLPGQYRVIAVARFADQTVIQSVAGSGAIPVCGP